MEIAGLLSNFSITQLPTKSTIEVVLNSLAHHTICLKPLYYIYHINNAITDLFGSVDESDLLKGLDEMTPDGKKISEYSLDGHLSTHEMRVLKYLQRYVSTLNVELSKVFLKYVTGMEVLRNELSIKVLFNGEAQLENMVPRSNTCSSSLHLSRYFMSYSPRKEKSLIWYNCKFPFQESKFINFQGLEGSIIC